MKLTIFGELRDPMPSRIRRVAVVMTALASLCATACATTWAFETDLSLGDPDAGGDVHVPDAPGVTDAGCNPDAQFTRRDVPGITRLGWPSVRSATLSPDERTIYFHGIPVDGGTEDIYVATRNSSVENFDDIRLVDGVNTAAKELAPSISADQLRIVFTRQTGDHHTAKLVGGSRLIIDAGFTPFDLGSVNSDAGDQNPFLTPMPGSSGSDRIGTVHRLISFGPSHPVEATSVPKPFRHPTRRLIDKILPCSAPTG
ncbi:hypothetical protein LVJ94_41315 [Pendulispora rubella]|uniref:Uncharacterized protein n=1 Tax=Pendulispora rubella TaxID=2741070 RepID=A0ABZ2L0I4_9BACT